MSAKLQVVRGKVADDPVVHALDQVLTGNRFARHEVETELGELFDDLLVLRDMLLQRRLGQALGGHRRFFVGKVLQQLPGQDGEALREFGRMRLNIRP